MTNSQKTHAAFRIVNSCEFITQQWEFEMMYKAILEAMYWGERVSISVLDTSQSLKND